MTLTYLHPDHLGTPKFGTPTGSKTVNLWMAGQYYDAESGLFYNWNRYYNPVIGRYISSDPIGIAGGLNTFNYVDQSPVMYSDPTGKNPLLILVGVGAYLFGDVTPANAPSSEDVTQPRVTETKHVTDAMPAIIGAKGLSSGYSSLFSPVQSVVAKTGEQCLAKNPIENLSPKIEKQMLERSWAKQSLQEALDNTPGIPAIGKKGPAIRYINPKTGQSVVVDSTTGEIFHVGGPGFKY
ncbi:MAG: hypothetical protein PHX61_06875 [Alphaproteobacteria bacterium]|nr:hypothetical protein [Alphaproteobacteria bacterium]